MAVLHLSEQELARLASELHAALPSLDVDEQKIARAVHRLLAEGEPVPESRIAHTAGVASDRVALALETSPGFVQRDERGDVVGFWGLTVQELSPHRLEVAGRQLWAWCALDALFLPFVLGRTAHIESVCARTGESLRAVVGPDRVEEVSPPGAVISLLRPEGPFSQDDTLSFCHHVLFFTSTEAGEQWIGDRQDHFLLTLEQGFELERRVWEAKYAAALTPARATS